MLTIDTIPLYEEDRRQEMGRHEKFSCLLSLVSRLLILFVQRMAAAATAELFELKPVRRALFVLCRHVVALFALRALQNYVISRHKTSRSSFVVGCSWVLFASIHEQRTTN